MATSTTGTDPGRSNLPRPSKSRLPVFIPRSGPRLATTRDPPPTAAASPSRPAVKPAASPTTPRVPKSPAVRPRAISSNAKPSQSPSDRGPSRGPSSDRLRTHSITKSSSRRRLKEPEPATPAKAVPAMSVKEAIALKRAEAKKAMAAQKTTSEHSGSSGLEDMLPTSAHVADDNDLGRLSLRETIERARSSGSLNIASRDLLCLPSALYQIHLSVTPEKLASVPDEPPLPEKPGKKTGSNSRTWYDQQDLTFLRARDNQIMELQPEISLFGSLKTIDLQNNRLVTLPDSIADLTSLVNLDLSHNALVSLPSHFFSLPSLTVLDLSHNSLTALPFSMPFDPATTAPAPSRRSTGFLSPPEIVRATRPLPRLTSLDASHNKINSSAIHHHSIPQDLEIFNLMYNPLGDVAELLVSLSALSQLVALRLSRCDIDDASFPATLLSSANRPTFPKLAVLDLEETRVTQAAISSTFSGLTQNIDFEASVTDERTVPRGTLAVAVGKRIVREAWEIEADRHVQRLRERRSAVNLKDTSVSELPPPPLPQPIQKEQWEIDAEQGLLSEGAQRRARAEAATQHATDDPGAVVGPTETIASHTTPVLARYWDPHNLTLTLPPSTGRSVRHGAGVAGEEGSLPRVTLPLSLIMSQPFADTLRILELRGRRAEPGIVLPTSSDGSQHLLPRLETLNLEGCALSDVVPGTELSDAGGTLGVLARLFPSLRNLELAYNDFTGAALGRGVLEQLLFSGDGDNGSRVGLRRLVLCGNKIEELHGLRELAQGVFGAGADVANTNAVALRGRWTLEELDVRENSIAVLPGELGLLPLDSFLVDGNLFRVPPRRVWEREGTKGLLMWLQGRLEAQ